MQGETIRLMKRGFSLQRELFPTVETCRYLQQSRFGVALPVQSKVQQEGRPATARLAERDWNVLEV
jgi:hypothetical protein